MNDFLSLSDAQIQKLIGGKVKAVRLRQNITQKDLADNAAISLSSVKKIEAGEINTFDSLLRVLRTLGMLDLVSSMCEDEPMSPSEYFKIANGAKRHVRKRASGSLKSNIGGSEW